MPRTLHANFLFCYVIVLFFTVNQQSDTVAACKVWGAAAVLAGHGSTERCSGVLVLPSVAGFNVGNPNDPTATDLRLAFQVGD